MNRDYAAALPILERLVEANPGSAELNYSLGHVLVNLQRPAAAVQRLEAVARPAPGLLPARASLGLAYLLLNKTCLRYPIWRLRSPRTSTEVFTFGYHKPIGEPEGRSRRSGRPQSIKKSSARWPNGRQPKSGRKSRPRNLVAQVHEAAAEGSCSLDLRPTRRQAQISLVVTARAALLAEARKDSEPVLEFQQITKLADVHRVGRA